MIGQRLLHYQIVEKLGEGGMGVVYKARDTHLDRFVAIKVLPPEKVADPQRKARFVQEAKAASALNHPNIVTVHDISSDDGRDFIAMEYVEGRTLDEVIGRKGLKLNEALKYAIQIADALAKAHAAGIVHRDLKPGNVMVTSDGRVKVLDFGLAKLTDTAVEPEDETRTEGQSTELGAIVGTASYMSPEQAAGKKVDARSDIFSFGAVLYEMLTGRRAFRKDTPALTLAAILHTEPPALDPAIPRDMEKVVMHCLRKDPARRYQYLADVKVALEDLKEESDSGALDGAAAIGRKGRRLWPLAAALAALLLAAGAWLSWRSLSAPSPAPRVVSLTSYPGVERQPTFSPDGRQMAFVWNGQKENNRDIYVKMVGSGAEPLRLTNDPAPDISPAWSPEASQIGQIAFIRVWDQGERAAIYLIPPVGPVGGETKLADFRPTPGFGMASAPAVSWSPDGKWLAISELEAGGEINGIFLHPVERGENRGNKQKIILGPVSAGRFHWPAFSPRGDFLAYAVLTGERSCDLYVQALGKDYVPKGQPLRLTKEGATIQGIAWAADGRSLVYSAATDLVAGFSLWRARISGKVRPEPLELAGFRAVTPAIKGDRLAFSRQEAGRDLWKFEEGAPPQRILSSMRSDVDPQFSPDGKRIAFSTDRAGKGTEIWIANRDGSNPRGLTEGNGRGVGTPRWSPDNNWIVYDGQEEDGHWHIYRVDAAGGQPRRLTPRQWDQNLPSYSRDGKWVYFGSNRTGQYEVWRTPATGGDPAGRGDVQITHEGGSDALESSDGKKLYYRRTFSLSPTAVAGALIERVLATGEERQILPSVSSITSYAPVDDGIYHIVPTGRSFGFEIRFLDLATRKDEVRFTADLSGGQGLTVSPDGKTILYSASAGSGASLMMVENFR